MRAFINGVIVINDNVYLSAKWQSPITVSFRNDVTWTTADISLG